MQKNSVKFYFCQNNKMCFTLCQNELIYTFMMRHIFTYYDETQLLLLVFILDNKNQLILILKNFYDIFWNVVI